MATIDFELFAPYNEEAALTGDFSDWDAINMEKGDDGTFRTSVELTDGEYRYKFRVRSKSWFFEEDAWVEVVDPYATAVEDSEAQNGILHIRDGQRFLDDYAWQHDGATLPPDDALVIYELQVADFSGGEDDPDARGKFKHVEEKLDYLSELGVNAVELMPVQEYPGDYSWGYNPRYLFAAESSYGSSEDLKHLIDACHGRGIRVILDMVFNHAESESPLTQIDHDYWYHHEPKDPDNTWGPEYNYGRYDEQHNLHPARKFVGEIIRYWVGEYHVDGIRFDAAKNIGDYEVMRWMVEEAKQAAGEKPFYTIAEHIPEVPDIVGQDGPMDGCWHNSFFHGITAHLCGQTFDLEEFKGLIDGKRKGFFGASSLVNYVASHDHGHLMAVLADCKIHDEEAFRRAKLGAVLTFTALGVPMLWMGQEFGEYKHKRLEASKIDWSLLENEPNRDLFTLYKGLVALRKENMALRTENLEFIHEDPEGRVFAFVRWHDEGAKMLTVVNLSDTHLAGYAVSGFSDDGPWHEWLRDYDVEVEGGQVSLELGAFEAHVFVK